MRIDPPESDSYTIWGRAGLMILMVGQNSLYAIPDPPLQ